MLLFPSIVIASCMKDNGHSWAIARGFEEICEVDGNAVHTVANAHAVGIQNVDLVSEGTFACRTNVYCP
jgi:hypothetical protein